MTPSVLVISSHVAASPVGMALAQPILAARGLSLIAAPTVILGRHPGWGAPGGGALPAEQLASLLAGIDQSRAAPTIGTFLTGYFSSAEQVHVAADYILGRKQSQNPPLVIVDPVIGDAPHAQSLPSIGEGGLFVSQAVAEAICERLLPLADWITPNAFELFWLARHSDTGRANHETPGFQDACGLASSLIARHGLKGAVVTSLLDPARTSRGNDTHPDPHAIGAVLIEANGRISQCATPRHAPQQGRRLPNGAGDALALSYAADLTRRPGQPGRALARAVALAGALIAQAVGAGAEELDPIACARQIARPRRARLHRVRLNARTQARTHRDE